MQNILTKNLDIIFLEYGNKNKDMKDSDLDPELEKYKYKVECSNCGYTFYRKRLIKNFIRKYRCGKCLGKFAISEGTFSFEKSIDA